MIKLIHVLITAREVLWISIPFEEMLNFLYVGVQMYMVEGDMYMNIIFWLSNHN